VHDPWFRIEHRTTPAEFQRLPEREHDRDRAFSTLIRNNGWLVERYAPDDERHDRWHETRARYRARSASMSPGGQSPWGRAAYAEGLRQLRATRRAQPRTPLPRAIDERFTGLAHARASLQRAWGHRPFATAAIIDPGRNLWAVRSALQDLGVREVAEDSDPEALVIGTLAPGPMLDAFERRQAQGLARGPKHVGYGPILLAPWLAIMDRQRPLMLGDWGSSPNGLTPEAAKPAATLAEVRPAMTLRAMPA
jgi:hypothetical protein